MKPLMQRMYEEKRLQMERRSIGGSYFMVQLPDGSMEKRMKMPINIDPGVHSSLNLDQLAAQGQGVGLHPVATLPTITESKAQDSNDTSPADSQTDASKTKQQNTRPARVHRNSESDAPIEFGTNNKNLPRNASQPAFTSHHQGLPKNGSVPTFDRVRKTSTSERFKPSLAAIKASSRGDMGNGDVCKSTNLRHSFDSFIAGIHLLSINCDGASTQRTQVICTLHNTFRKVFLPQRIYFHFVRTKIICIIESSEP